MRRFHAIGDGTTRRVWVVDRLWALAAALPVRDLPLSSLDVLDRDAWFGHTHVPTLRAVADHARRMDEADLAYPIVLGADGRVMDGLHRVAQALRLGRTTLPAVQFPTDPDPDLIEPWLIDGPEQVLAAQVAAWNRGDLEGYLDHVHPEVCYQHGDVVLTGRDALRAHYDGRVQGILAVRILSQRQTAHVAVLMVEASLDTGWTGRALLTMEREGGRWWLSADATAS